MWDGETFHTRSFPQHTFQGISASSTLFLKKIGVLWKKSDKHDKDYLAGQLDLGVFGKVQIAVFQTPEKQNEQSPDATIHLFEGD
jgi:uncharacterized protein (DUF736 family)